MLVKNNFYTVSYFVFINTCLPATSYESHIAEIESTILQIANQIILPNIKSFLDKQRIDIKENHIWSENPEEHVYKKELINKCIDRLFQKIQMAVNSDIKSILKEEAGNIMILELKKIVRKQQELIDALSSNL